MNFTLIAKETVPLKAKYSLAPVTVYIRDMNDNFTDFTQPIYEVKFSTYTIHTQNVVLIKSLG
jgi:hypothetical protein